MNSDTERFHSIGHGLYNEEAWAVAMFERRGVAGIRVLMGLQQLIEKHSCGPVEQACGTADGYGAYQLRVIRQLVKHKDGPPAEQQQFDFVEDDPVIRSLDEYRDFIHQTLQKEHCV